MKKPGNADQLQTQHKGKIMGINLFTVMRPTLMGLCRYEGRWTVTLRANFGSKKDFAEGFEQTEITMFGGEHGDDGDDGHVDILAIRTKDLLHYERFRVAALDEGILLTPMLQQDWERMLVQCMRDSTGALDEDFVMAEAAKAKAA
jgi:hypothetical protein